MANSKLLKQAIADAKAVKETALANAKLALEEAFTPRLQSILSQKMRAEAEEMESYEDDDMKTEELSSSTIGSSDMKTPNGFDAHTEFEAGSTDTQSGEPGSEIDDYSKIKDLNEEDEEYDDMESDDMESDDMGGDDFESDDMGGDDFESDMSDDGSNEDDMDLEAIIRELEQQLGDEQPDDEDDTESDDMQFEEDGVESDEIDLDVSDDEDDENGMDEPIDLEEILREMESDMKGDYDSEEMEKKDQELSEAYKTIKSLQSTINEVNLLNAKLLFANKLFRAHNMTNEQKVKVIETLDRTKSVREVKLVYSTLAENFKYSNVRSKVSKKSITEGIASKAIKSTKPAAAQRKVISENADLANRFKKLAGIIK